MRHPAYRFTKWGEDLYGGALQCALSNAPARILSGPYDTGKTYSCLHMMNIYAMEYPGARLTFAHKTRDQVDRVIVPTFETSFESAYSIPWTEAGVDMDWSLIER